MSRTLNYYIYRATTTKCAVYYMQTAFKIVGLFI